MEFKQASLLQTQTSSKLRIHSHQIDLTFEHHKIDSADKEIKLLRSRIEQL